MPNPQRVGRLIADYLRDRRSDAPSPLLMQRLVETLFYASLKTEEARGVSCTIVFVGSGTDLNEVPDSARRSHRYVYVPLARPIILTPASLAKFSHAAPPWASCIAIRQKNDHLEICGLFDQEIHYQNALNREGEARFFRPGWFQIEVTGTGMLTVYDDRKLLARLSQDSLVTTFHDVLNEGPIANQLIRYIDKLEQRAGRQLKRIYKRDAVTSLLVDAPRLWLQTLSRILLGIRRLKHGGAVLLLPSKPGKDLSISFPLSYERTETIIERHLVAFGRWQVARTRMRTEYSEPGDSIPATLVQERRSAFNEQEDARKGELGCAAFISSLAGVDGLILLSGGLRVLGFGVEIKLRKDPAKVLLAGNARGSLSRLKQLTLSQFGTRHRSMMRYCDRHPGSIGFVISQDGDIRAITKTERGLIVWDNIRLQEVEAEQRSGTRESQRRGILRRREQIEQQLKWSVSYKEVQRDFGVKRQVWLTRSGDPLKIRTETKTKKRVSELQLFFGRNGDVVMAISRNDQASNGETIVEEVARYFESWQLIAMTRKTAGFRRGEQINMAGIKADRLDLPELGEVDRTSSAWHEQGEQTIRALLRGKQRITPLPTSPKADRRRFRFIQGTSSPDGRFALGFGTAQRIVPWASLDPSVDEVFGREHHYASSEDLSQLIRNYVVDLKTNKILGETNCHYPGTRRSYNHRTCQTIWSPNNQFLIQLFQGKWATIEAAVIAVAQTRLQALDLLELVDNYAYQFLTQRKDRAFRRFGAGRFTTSLSCDGISNSGVFRLQVFGQIPKAVEDETTFNVIQRFQAVDRRQGLSLKFLDCQFGPRLY